MKAIKPTKLLTAGLLNLLLSTLAFADPVSLEMNRADSGAFYINAELDVGVETELLLDTGSSYVGLTRATFDRFSDESEPLFSRHIYGALASGKVEKVPLYLLKSLKLADNCILEDIEVAVFPRADKNILGLNALSRLESFTLELASSRLTSAGCKA